LAQQKTVEWHSGMGRCRHTVRGVNRDSTGSVYRIQGVISVTDGIAWTIVLLYFSHVVGLRVTAIAYSQAIAAAFGTYAVAHTMWAYAVPRFCATLRPTVRANIKPCSAGTPRWRALSVRSRFSPDHRSRSGRVDRRGGRDDVGRRRVGSSRTGGIARLLALAPP
jgi:hypothetical protein